jgi:hypothetical protein
VLGVATRVASRVFELGCLSSEHVFDVSLSKRLLGAVGRDAQGLAQPAHKQLSEQDDGGLIATCGAQHGRILCARAQTERSEWNKASGHKRGRTGEQLAHDLDLKSAGQCQSSLRTLVDRLHTHLGTR